VKLISGTGAKSVARDSMAQQSLKSTMKKCTVSSIIYDMAIVSFKQDELPQVLHRLQNKENPMQNNFDSPVRVTQNDFRVQHCKV